MPYCGGKSYDPRGTRPLAASPGECKGQLRAYGRRLIQDDGAYVAAQTLLKHASKSGPTCGRRSPGKRLVDCKRQRRLYGLLPFIDSPNDMTFRSYVATTAEESRSDFPRVVIDHGYTLSVYEHTHPEVKGVVLFISCAAKDESTTSAVYEHPQTTPGSIGWALGYFDRVRSTTRSLMFNITRVEVNPAYRGGECMSWILMKLTDAVRRRSSSLFPSATGVTLQIDPNGKCFQMGNGIMELKLEKALASGYSKAGFSEIKYKEGRRMRRTFQKTFESLS